MNNWEIVEDKASIVLLGSFNPRIFHPEWLINRQIVDSWNYNDEAIICMPDFTQIHLPDSKTLSVYINRFILESTLASNNLALADLATNIFVKLSETPLEKLGMNYSATIHLRDQESWMNFGKNFAPIPPWKEACLYLQSELTDNQEKEIGLWSMTMHFPRPDKLNGFLRPKIEVASSEDRTLTFSINNHVELDQMETSEAMKILSEYWEDSLSIAEQLIENMMNNQLQG